MATITPGISNVPPQPERGEGSGERIADRTLRLRRKGHRRADTNVDNRLKGIAPRNSAEPSLDHGTLRGGREDRK
jgi:hypothetical protein